jgi:5'(3')-deoxyribonucleotidase
VAVLPSKGCHACASMIRQLKLEGTKVLKLYFDAKHNIRKCIRMLRWKDVAVERSGLGSAKSQTVGSA